MRAHEFIIEELEDKSAESFIQKVTTECSEILEAYKQANWVLFRGIRHPNKSVNETPQLKPAKYPAISSTQKNKNINFIYKTIRTDRAPIEFPTQAQTILSNVLREKGIETNRGNSIFCSGLARIANSWGENYIVFPTNGWKAMWFDRLSVHSYSFDKLNNIYYKSLDDHLDTYYDHPDILYEEYKYFCDLYQPIETNNSSILSNYISKKPFEIMISGPSYYGISFDHFRSYEGWLIRDALGLGKIIA